MIHLYQQKDKIVESCFNIETSSPLNTKELNLLKWLLSDLSVSDEVRNQPVIASRNIPEVGPRLNFETAYSTNAMAICHAVGLTKITRIEISQRYYTSGSPDYDKMTQMIYPKPLTTFDLDIKPKPVRVIPILEEGKPALAKINNELGLGMDDWDLNYYTNLFINVFRRNPTDVECFQLGQANSEHSRHWFFKGKLIIDGVPVPHTLMDIIKNTLKSNPNNSLIAFSDNSSAIRGFNVWTILPQNPGYVSGFEKQKVKYHLLFTAETHNFPSGVAPFPGAETGAGGRIRDTHATGTGSLVVAGTAGYCVGNLNIQGYKLPWENKHFEYPTNLASPVEILIQASNGASDYGNKFGEPLINGFTRSFGLILPDNSRQEWIKPIMFSGGVGQISDDHLEKETPQIGALIIQVGGPAYRIGVGGGAASSMIQGENKEELDFNAVQRGDAQMQQKANRVIRACIETGKDNPILSVHDQGAGGPCNVITEIVEPTGGRVDIRNITLGDKTMSVLEIWGAEYQENTALLINPDRLVQFAGICQRENVDCKVLGEITGDGQITVYDSNPDTEITTPVNLNLGKILGKMPQKTFEFTRKKLDFPTLRIPTDLSITEALKNIFQLVQVGSKGFLVRKVDRSVTGLIAQQQCVGHLQLPISDYAMIAQSHFGNSGAAISIGEAPNKMMIDYAEGAKLAVAEALTNILFAGITHLEDIKTSVNWMWAAKLAHEGANLYDAAYAMSEYMIKLGIAVDGGKDSLSMATKVGGNVVKSPGQMTVSAYAPVADVNKAVTADIKHPGSSSLILIKLSDGKNCLGGSALAQTQSQFGSRVPKATDPYVMKSLFQAFSELNEIEIIKAGHDISDGGLITTLSEMGVAGACGLVIDIFEDYPIAKLFSEEPGIVVECLAGDEPTLLLILQKYKLSSELIGYTTTETKIVINNQLDEIFSESLETIKKWWEATSFELEKHQMNSELAEVEYNNPITKISYHTTFKPENTPKILLRKEVKPKVAILREQGSNGDREMASAFFMAGFEPWDVTMTDLANKKITLEDFKGIAFVGGFSFADVLGSAKGWAAQIKFNPYLANMFSEFYFRADTFSLGICNGCQLMALLGWVPFPDLTEDQQPIFLQNNSERFESRWSRVKIYKSPSIMLSDMAGSVLGIWVAHGEGRIHFPDQALLEKVIKHELTPIAYVDPQNQNTEIYPYNPNGSPHGIASLCSTDGRHLAMMPHPERAFIKWQWPHLDNYHTNDWEVSPWLKMFQNAFVWVDNQ